MKLIIQHKVADFDRWKAEFDAFSDYRQSAGIVNPRLYRGVEDANDVVGIFDVTDIDAADGFLYSDEVEAFTEKAGIVGEPTVYFLEDQ